MANSLLDKTVQFVDESYGGKLTGHFERTLYWVKKLKPEADEALLIAAYAHDIQRAFASNKSYEKVVNSKKGFKDEEMMRLHQEDGAKIMKKFLLEHNADKQLIDKVVHLISKHEVGGDKEQNLLKDADSLSFFETNVKHFIKEKAKEFGKEKIKNKFNFMFSRISSAKAKKIAKPMYKKAIQKLEESKVAN